jgi:hypothetical protein
MPDKETQRGIPRQGSPTTTSALGPSAADTAERAATATGTGVVPSVEAGARVRGEASERAGSSTPRSGLLRPQDADDLADKAGCQHRPPLARVTRLRAIVAHHEVRPRRDLARRIRRACVAPVGLHVRLLHFLPSMKMNPFFSLAGLCGGANEDLVQCHAARPRDREQDDLGDVLRSDREFLDERFSCFSGAFVGDVAG